MQVSVNLVSIFFTVAAVASIIGNSVYLKINKKSEIRYANADDRFTDNDWLYSYA